MDIMYNIYKDEISCPLFHGIALDHCRCWILYCWNTKMWIAHPLLIKNNIVHAGKMGKTNIYAMYEEQSQWRWFIGQAVFFFFSSWKALCTQEFILEMRHLMAVYWKNYTYLSQLLKLKKFTKFRRYKGFQCNTFLNNKIQISLFFLFCLSKYANEIKEGKRSVGSIYISIVLFFFKWNY